MSDLGIVIIGRNEGPRLQQCLQSVQGAGHIVYVDSGSTDNSVAMARGLGVDVVELDMTQPFTAARARNAGFDRLVCQHPQVRFVQFVDGDCEVVPGWLATAQAALETDPKTAGVCGRRRERFPEKSAYNRLCDIEWNTPVGEAPECGGDVMFRTDALRQAGGYNPAIIAAEDTELSVRLRLQGWKLRRLDAEMTLHDAAMTRLGQWWKRNIRAGHGFAEIAHRHGRSPLRFWVRQTRSIWFWGLLLPLLALGLAWPTRGISLVVFLAYPLQLWRARRANLRWPMNPSDAALYAVSCIAGKFPQALGQMKYWLGRLIGRQSGIIEYKGQSHPATQT